MILWKTKAFLKIYNILGGGGDQYCRWGVGSCYQKSIQRQNDQPSWFVQVYLGFSTESLLFLETSQSQAN